MLIYDHLVWILRDDGHMLKQSVREILVLGCKQEPHATLSMSDGHEWSVPYGVHHVEARDAVLSYREE